MRNKEDTKRVIIRQTEEFYGVFENDQTINIF